MNRQFWGKVGYGLIGIAVVLMLIMGAAQPVGAVKETLNSLIGLMFLSAIIVLVVRAKKFPKAKLVKNKPNPNVTPKPITGGGRTVDIETRIAGVTFSNDDGSDRQQIIAEMDESDSITLEPYLYNDEPAVYVKNIIGQIIGNVPKSLAARVYKAIKEKRLLSAEINEVYPAGNTPAGIRITISLAEN